MDLAPIFGNLSTTPKLLRSAAAVFFRNLRIFSLLILLLLSFRTFVIFSDHLLSPGNLRTHFPGLFSSPENIKHSHYPRNTSAGITHNELFSGVGKEKSNLSANDNVHFLSPLGIRLPEAIVVREGPLFSEGNEKNQENGEVSDGKVQNSEAPITNPETSFQHVVKVLFFWLASNAIGVCILKLSLETYTAVLGISFLTVVNGLLGRAGSPRQLLRNHGPNLGVQRLTLHIGKILQFRSFLTEILAMRHFLENHDTYLYCWLSLKFLLTPYLTMPVWIQGFDGTMHFLLLLWLYHEFCWRSTYAMYPWEVLPNTGGDEREISEEVSSLISMMERQSIELQYLQLLFCGLPLKWEVGRACGELVAEVIHSAVEVYFIVAWVLFYLGAKHRKANYQGRRFGRRQLEEYIDAVIGNHRN